jgi:hypothetical protein
MAQVDLGQIAERLRAASDRAKDLTVTTSATDLILSRGGDGTGRSEALPFAALFLRSDDALAKALERLGC